MSLAKRPYDLRQVWTAIKHQRIAVLEHPAEALEPLFASIWRLPQMKRMLSLPGVDKVLIKQHHYWAASVKPTHLLVINGGRARDI